MLYKINDCVASKYINLFIAHMKQEFCVLINCNNYFS